MTILPRSLRIPYTSEAFKSLSIPNGRRESSVTWCEIVWAALTIGRPSTHDFFQHGTSSLYEAVFRVSLVRMALEQHGPRAARLRRTSAFKNLDPTEKGAINYFLGMTFCKVFSSKILSTPWLLHLDIYRSMFPVSALGRSRPDLFGQQTVTGDWHAFESKGRTSKPSASDIKKAKVQASRLESVNGDAFALHIGTFTYFSADVLNFHWIDPSDGTDRPLNIPEIGDNWRYYYAPVSSLLEEAIRSGESGTRIVLPQFDLEIEIHQGLHPFLVLRQWEAAQRHMNELYET